MLSWERQISGHVVSRIRSKRIAVSIDMPEDLPKRGPVRLREAGFADFIEVAALKKRHKLSLDSAANWQRIWNCNPVMEASGRIPMGWVLEGHDGIVGYLGNITLRGFYRGQPLRIASTHAFVVQAEYRFYAAGLVAAYFRQKGVDLFVSTSTIESAGKIFQAYRGQFLPQADYDTALFWVIDPYGFLASVQKRLEFRGAAATCGTRIGSWALRADRALRRRRLGPRAQTCRIDILSPASIDDDFDKFWRRKLAATASLITDRSAAVLRWHFSIPGDQRRPVVLRCFTGGRMAGYAVVLTIVSRDGMKKAIIADMLVENEDSSVPHQLLSAAFEYARRTEHHVLEVLGLPRAVHRACSQWHPYTRTLPSSPYLFKAVDPGLQKSLGSEDAWYATPYDGDATLIPQLEAETAPAAAACLQTA